jgi:hypothetical protein
MKKSVQHIVYLVIVVAVIPATGVRVVAQAGASTAPRIYVKDYNALPNDGADDAKGIQDALHDAKAKHITEVVFDAGQYDLLTTAAPALNACAGLQHYNGLRITGAVLPDGAPATRLVKKNTQQNNTILPSHIRFDYCKNLVIQNLVFDNNPQYASAGKVVEKGDDYITVQVFDGLPATQGMGCYTANVWELPARQLKQVPSLTFIDDVAKENLFWQLQVTEGRRYLRMNSSRFAKQVVLGDGLSWHYGAQTMFQLAINYCHDLTLNNMLTVNIAGWGIQTYACKNINAHNIRFKANGNQLAVGPRDAWKLNSCNGLVQIDSMYVEGVRWDGQNVHGAFWQVKEILAHNKMRVWKKYTGVAPFIGDSIGFWQGGNAIKRVALHWQPEQQADGGVYGIVETNDSLPAFAQPGTLVTVYAWDIDHYKLQNSTFKNIAGCAGVIKCTRATLQRVNYDHIMYPALVIGTEITAHNEATFPQDVLIRQCYFSQCGWISRINTKGIVGIANSGNTAMVIGAVHFDGCSFAQAATGIDASGIKLLKITNSQFTSVAQPYKTNSSNTGKVIFENNTVAP